MNKEAKKNKTFREQYKVTPKEEEALSGRARQSILRRLDIRKATEEALSQTFVEDAKIDIRVSVSVKTADLIETLKFRRERT